MEQKSVRYRKRPPDSVRFRGFSLIKGPGSKGVVRLRGEVSAIQVSVYSLFVTDIHTDTHRLIQHTQDQPRLLKPNNYNDRNNSRTSP